MYLKQSTAITLKLGPFLDDADGKTAETALTLSQADVRLSKNGGAFAQKNDATAATHDENGWYGVPLNTTDTDTLGRLRIAIAESGALPVWEHYMVLPANVYDALVNGSDYLNVEVAAMAANTLTATAIASDAITAAKVAADVTTEIQNGLATAAALATVATYVDTEVAAIKAKTDNLPSDPADASDIATAISGLNNLSAAQVASELATYDAPTKAELDAAVAPLATAAALTIVDDFLDTEIAAIKAKTDNLPADPADESSIQATLATIAGYLDTEIAAIAAAIAALNNLSTADVNAQMLDVLVTDTFAEPSSVPLATASLKDKIGWLAALARNKVTQTASATALRNDADSANIATASNTDDLTTFTRSEWS